MMKLLNIFEEINIYADKVINMSAPDENKEEAKEQEPKKTPEEKALEEDLAMEEQQQQEIANAKAELVGALQNTLAEMGEDPNESVFESDIVRLRLDRSRLKMSGKVYIYLTEKRTGEEFEGFINITDLPTHFKSYKLNEDISRIKEIIRY